jgi:hypothetical protein
MKPNPSYIHTILRSLLAGMLALAIASAVTGCGGGSPVTLTQANLDKILPDMSSAEVKSILGEPTSSTSEPIPIVGGTKTTYTYTNQNAQVVIVLKNDKVQTKEGHFGNQ